MDAKRTASLETGDLVEEEGAGFSVPPSSGSDVVEVPDRWPEMNDRERLGWIRERQRAARETRDGR